MARLVTKFKYLKPNRKVSAGGYAKYIATREGVEKIDDTKKFAPATTKQKNLIEKILKDFPDSKDMFEYVDYLEKQNQGSASDFISKMPEGYDTVVGERGVGLSGGQKQRISLARALAVRPSILILDDTTSAVDMETEKQIQEALRHLDFSCTKVIIAQRISTTMMADKILVMQHGRITEMGNHEELMAKKGYYYELVQLQTGEDLG